MDLLPFEKPVERPPHPAALSDDVLLEQCTQGRSRTSGPGGQNRNKVETAVELTHHATGVRAKAGERRSVKENRRVAIRRLRLNLAVEHREFVPDGDIRSALWRRRLQGTKLVVNPKHAEYPALLAEALDVLDASGFDPRVAATRLTTTPSQLLRLVKHHPPAFAALNASREARGEHALK
ncbi:MAG: peptide chain release factor-like protein [Planctomycetota bacterium]